MQPFFSFSQKHKMTHSNSLNQALAQSFALNIAPHSRNIDESVQFSRGIENSETNTLVCKSAASELTAASVSKGLREAVGKSGDYSTSIGAHPEFTFLAEGENEYHHCVSVFVDLKGSTKLARSFDLPRVQQIKNGLLKSAIQIFQAFDGHIHRLQGDAVFALFCKKGGVKEDAIVDALNAASILQAFIADNLNPNFTSLGLPEISARVGVDFGDDSDVLWSRYGVGECHEITTTSLHTDLASKLQSEASVNKVMIGDNIKKYLDLPKEFYSVKKVVRNGDSVDKRYVFEYDGYRYPMWVFEWEKYLKGFAVARTSGTPLLTSAKTLGFSCHFTSQEESLTSLQYLSGCGTLPKEVNLRFKLSIPMGVRWNRIRWTVENRGDESTSAGAETFEMDDYKNKTECVQVTAYKGHHYMRCRLYFGDKIVGDEKIGLFVR